MKVWFTTVLALFAAIPSAHAHQSSVAYTDVTVGDGRKTFQVSVRVASGDLFEALSLDSDRAATRSEIETGAAALAKYVRQRVDVELGPDGLACQPGESRVEPELFSGTLYARVSWTTTCKEPASRLALEYDLFFDLDPLHTSPIRARFALEKASDLLTAKNNRFEWDLAQPPPSGFFGFLVSGAEHILFGPDHILFLVSLLFVAVVAGQRGQGRVRSVKESTRYTLTIVTAFTIAHSITLVAAALGAIPIPSQVVESIIALSIVYVAVENVLRPEPPARFIVTFVFGLLHGMGFASMLREFLPSEGLVIPVVAFNLGVEIGQLALVAILLPVLALLASRLGAPRYRRTVVPVGCAAVGILGLVWLIERIFDLSIIS